MKKLKIEKDKEYYIFSLIISEISYKPVFINPIKRVISREDEFGNIFFIENEGDSELETYHDPYSEENLIFETEEEAIKEWNSILDREITNISKSLNEKIIKLKNMKIKKSRN